MSSESIKETGPPEANLLTNANGISDPRKKPTKNAAFFAKTINLVVTLTRRKNTGGPVTSMLRFTARWTGVRHESA
jgi:hypothetical protein